MKKYKVLLCGAGSIGALKDNQFDSPESKQIYTHAHACYSHPLIDLVGVVDSDYSKAVTAARKWNTYANKSISDFYKYDENKETDIVIVATNTNTHHNIIRELVQYKPKIIICEKPFCSNLEEAQKITNICKVNKIQLIINYTRTFVPELKQLSTDLLDGKYGQVYNFTLRYSRGLMREACHAFYWCLQTFGDAYGNYSGYRFYDSPTPGDFSTYFKFKTRLCFDCAFIPIGKAYSTYNADIYTEKGRIELLNNWKTIRFHENMKSTYGDYSATGLLFIDKQTQLDQALTFLLDHAIKRIEQPNYKPDLLALDVHQQLNFK